MRHLAIAFLLAGAVACGTASETSDPPAPDETTSTAEGGATTSTVAPGTSTTSISGETATTASGREKAPDFTLDLGDGGSYTLSEGAKPVYLVFWAEW